MPSRTIDPRWNALLNDFRRSGLTQAEFCRRREISLSSFRNHLYKPNRSKSASSNDRPAAGAGHRFLPVTIIPDPTSSIPASQSHIELILSNGRRIAVAPGFDPETLRHLIAVVEEHPCSG
ncbi:MAG: IS66 family insertion sequence element accessory protein TnpA [Isosphaeraceae bacterium]